MRNTTVTCTLHLSDHDNTLLLHVSAASLHGLLHSSLTTWLEVFLTSSLHVCPLSRSYFSFFLFLFKLAWVLVSFQPVSPAYPPKLSMLFPLHRLWSWRPGAKPQPQDGGTSLSFQQKCVLTCFVLWQSSCHCLLSPCSSMPAGPERFREILFLWLSFLVPLEKHGILLSEMSTLFLWWPNIITLRGTWIHECIRNVSPMTKWAESSNS